MCKRAMLMLLALIMVPSFTSAATYWQISATTSPTALKTNLTAARPANFGNYTTPGGAAMTLTKVTRSPYNSVSFDVAAVSGYTVKVKVDGVQVGTLPGTYSVAKGSLLNHNIVATYTAVSSQYALTTMAAGGGSISPSSSYVSNGAVTVTPYTGYVLTGLKIGAVTYLLADTLPGGISRSGDGSGATYTFASGSYTLQGVFTVAPKATAVISTPNLTVSTGAAGIEIDGSTSTSNVAGTIYSWFATCGTVVPTSPNAKTATYTAPATVGTCTVTLIVNAVGVTPNPTADVNITTQSETLVDTQICLDCHNGTDGPASMGYETSAHMGVTSCKRCHNPDNTASHAYEPFAVVANTCPSCHSTPPVAHTVAGNCSNCHTPHSLAVKDVTSTTSVCVSCHTTATPAVELAWQSGAHGAASGHTTGTCQRCHASKGAIVGANVGWTGSYANVLTAFQAAIWTPNQPVSTNGISCAVCHDPHSGSGLLPINTYNGTAAVAWDPNQNGQNNDQFDLCTSCHTIYDNNGALTDMYHEKSSINVTRMLADSHFDNPATGVGLTTNVVEGYVIRAKGANPCADCHNVHKADLTIQEAWAKSAHAGKIAAKKDEAACAQSVIWFNTTYPTDLATACTDSKTVGPSTRTVLAFFQRNAAGVAFYKTVGALDDAAGNGWTHYNWDQTSSRGSCQRCHTATGIANFLDSPTTYVAAGTGNDFSHLSGWTAAAGSPQQELLYCWGCHSDAQTGALRNPGAITEIYAAATAGSPTATVVYPDLNQSNVCMGCHLGREIGQNVTNDTDADGVRSFINSHYLTAGSTIFNKSGYEFANQNYSSAGYHKNVGMADAYNTGTAGPCVTCHMTSAEGHAFELVTKDATGAITAVTSTQCANCHGNLTAAAMNASKHEFHLALEELKTALEAKGIYFYPAHPYFYAGANGTGGAFTNWAGVYGLANWKNVMGAAFNYNLFDHDPGAYAHNRQYALKLIQDSIDFLADGVVNGAGIPAAFTTAAANKEFAETTTHTPVAVVAPSPSNCTTCHTPETKHYGGTVLVKAQYVAPATTVDTNGGSCADCHSDGTGAVAGTINKQFGESAHGSVTGEGWMHYDWRISTRAACARCHNATAYIAKLGIESNTSWIYTATDVNKAGEVLSCNACHTDISTGAVRTPGIYTETYTDGATFAFPDIGKSNLCMRCHSGRESGGTIAADTDADGVRSFINSHYLTAGGTVFATTGYEFAGQSYANVAWFAHDKAGIATPGSPLASDAGPCASCHMGAGSANHTWEVVAKDATGAVTAINSNSCASCHAGGYELTPAKLNEEAEGYHAALEVLDQALASKGMFFAPNSPYFFTAPWIDYTPPAANPNVSYTNWAGPYGFANYKQTMGAAFNYNLLHHDPGGYAHNMMYAKRLIFDSIDFIDNGVLDGTIDLTAHTAAAAYLNAAAPVAAVTRP